MTLRNRFFLIGAGLIVFILVSPLLVLFARGYKIDFEQKKLIKTGSLIVKSEPTKADIYLNDNKQKHLTSATLRFLIPGDYNISIKKDGYQAWTKRLTIQSEVVTWANLNREFIALLFETPHLLETRSMEAAFKSPDQKSLYFIQDGTIHQMNLEGNRSENFGGKDLWPLLNTNYSHAGSSSLYALVSASRNLNLSTEQAAIVKKIETNPNFTAVLVGPDLVVWDANNNPINNIPGVSEFTLENRNIWYISESNIKRLDLRNGETEIIRDDLPLAQNTQIIRGDDTLFVNINNSLFIHSDELERIYDGVLYAYWDTESNRLIYSNDHEIFIYDPSTKHNELVLRSSTKISDPVLNKKTGYVFFSNEGKIKAIELDGRDHRNIYNLTDVKNQFAISADGKLLYVFDDNELKSYQIR